GMTTGGSAGADPGRGPSRERRDGKSRPSLKRWMSATQAPAAPAAGIAAIGVAATGAGAAAIAAAAIAAARAVAGAGVAAIATARIGTGAATIGTIGPAARGYGEGCTRHSHAKNNCGGKKNISHGVPRCLLTGLFDRPLVGHALRILSAAVRAIAAKS